MEPVCPQCGRDFVRRCHREGALEQLLSIAYIYPFRCQLCTHRFRAMEWGKRYNKRRIDKRQYERIATRFPVTFSGDQVEGKGEVADLSIEGCGLETETPPEVGALLQLKLYTTSEQEPAVVVDAAVVRSVRSRSVGVKFLRLSAEHKGRLSQYMRNLLVTSRP